MKKIHLLCWVVAAFLSPTAWAQAADADTYAGAVKRYVTALGSNSKQTSDDAEVGLAMMPPQAFAVIEKAAEAPDLKPQAAARLKKFLNRQRPWTEARLRIAKIRHDEFEWNQRTALEAYGNGGHTSPKWDAAAKEAIQQFVKPGQDSDKCKQLLAGVIEAGCDDPLILYFQSRVLEITSPTQMQAVETFYRLAAEGMAKSNYPADRKFMASLYMAKCELRLELQKTGGRALTPQGRDAVRQPLGVAMELWPQVCKEDEPPGMLMKAAELLLDTHKNVAADQAKVYDQIYAPLAQAMPDRPEPFLFKGIFYIAYAWDARGSGFANTVTEDGWKLFGERLDTAGQALTKAWELDPKDPRAATKMITVELGQGKGREVMERWFKRAMEADPDNREACKAKLYYLQPKWHGSPQAMLQFGHDCLDSKNWYGTIPFTLIDAHDELMAYVQDPDAYLRLPVVWQDYQSVYEPYLRARPENNLAGSAYALLACKSGNWEIAKREFDTLGDKMEPRIFGGVEVMESYRKTAEEKGTPAAAP
ncbi:MAG: hypothetical protein JWN24_4261 [Phycisphaerales bacterium]|nr:hypothetical protein [Phycisphaerales bacterium]